MKAMLCIAVAFAAALFSPVLAAEQLPYPQRIWTRYEAADPNHGGDVVIWVEQERIWYTRGVTHGITNAMLFPPARYVEVTQITPMPRSPAITLIEVSAIGSSQPDFYRFTGFLRLKVSGMRKTATNADESK